MGWASEEDPAAHIRGLGRGDRPLLRDHLLRLDPESRYERFAMAAGDDFLEDYAERCLGADDLAFGYCVDGALRGVGELRGLGGGGAGAEAAVSVEREWRGCGVGAALFDRIVEAARETGETRLRLVCLPYNRAMQKIVHECSPLVRFETDAQERPCAIRPSREAWRESFDDDGYSAIVDLCPRTARLQPA